MNKRLIITLVILVVGTAGVVLLTRPNKTTVSQEIDSFEGCKKAGYPILESYPRQCRTPNGKTFTEEIATEQSCAKNGERVNRNPLLGPTNKQCCPELVEEKVSRSYSICTSSIIENSKEECIKVGEEISPKEYEQGIHCCSGLQRINTDRYFFLCEVPGEGTCGTNGCSIPPPTSDEAPWWQCTPCGNGACEAEYGENRCNCPKDCK